MSLIVVCVVLFCGAVGAQTPLGLSPPRNTASAGIETVPFVSMRDIERHRNGFDYYGPSRGALSAGECTVDLEARERRQIIGLVTRDFDELITRLVTASPRVILYVHGYNVSFEQGCRDAARLMERLGPEHRLLLFSWPADNKVTGYLRDVGDVDWSVEPLKDLLVTLTDHYGAGNVDVIGHSLGSKAVVDAVTHMAEASGAAVLGRVVLVAPDVDADVFVRDFDRLEAGASAITVYVSPQDRALKASRNIRNEPRLGEGGADLSGLSGLDVVEVEQRRLKWWSTHHQYYLENDAVASDLRDVLTGPPHASGSRRIGH